jgi:hypothetical protein
MTLYRAIFESGAVSVGFGAAALAVAWAIHGAFLWHDLAPAWTAITASATVFCFWLAFVARSVRPSTMRVLGASTAAALLTPLLHVYPPAVWQLYQGETELAGPLSFFGPALFGAAQIIYGGWVLLLVFPLLGIIASRVRQFGKASA